VPYFCLQLKLHYITSTHNAYCKITNKDDDDDDDSDRVAHETLNYKTIQNQDG